MRLDEMRHQESLPSWRDEWAAHIDDLVNHWQGEISREPSPYWKSEAIARYVKIVRETKYV